MIQRMQRIIETTHGLRTIKLKLVAEVSNKKAEEIITEFINNRGFVSGMESFSVTPINDRSILKQGIYELILINRKMN